jgi:hypothetical protein
MAADLCGGTPYRKCIQRPVLKDKEEIWIGERGEDS